MMEIRERRESNRLRTNLPVSFENLGLKREFGETLAKDISTTGIRVNFNKFLTPKTKFLVKIRFPEVQRVLSAMASVAWSQRISYSDKYQAGLSFYEINPQFKGWIDEYIKINKLLSR